MKSSIALSIIASALLATSCANTVGAKLPQPTGNDIRINSTAETQRLLRESGIVLVGPKEHDEATVNMFMREPMLLLSRQPNEADFKRLGAALVKTTVIVTFSDGSAEFRPTGSQRFHMRQLSARAKRVELRGRTSNNDCTSGSEWIATERAMAAQRYLLGHKMPSVDMSINVMCSGDFIADNRTKAGRDLNRRVELEYFFEGEPFDPIEHANAVVTTNDKSAANDCNSDEWQTVGGTLTADGCLK